MTSQPTPEDPEQAAKRGRVGIIVFVVATVASLAFFAFFPGLPHVIDWGAILVSLAVGMAARWAYRAWTTRSRLPSG